MRKNTFGEQYAQPTDTAEDVYDASGAEPFTHAELENNADENFGYGGTLSIDHSDVTFPFDGFETREAALSWLLEQFGIEESNVRPIG